MLYLMAIFMNYRIFLPDEIEVLKSILMMHSTSLHAYAYLDAYV